LIGEWDSKDTIAVIVVYNEDVVVACTGWHDELASEIHVCLSGGFHHGGITVVGVFTFVEGRGKGVVIGGCRWCWYLGRLLVHPGLVQMSFDSGIQ